MAYDREIMRRARERFEAERERRRNAWELRRQALYARAPRLREIENRLRGTTGSILAEAMRRGYDPRPALEKLRRENLQLREERKNILKSLGLSETYLHNDPACSVCGDSGYANGRVCQCLRRYYVQEQQKALSQMLDLGNQSFESFSLDWYPNKRNGGWLSPREQMRENYEICLDYARNFENRQGRNLLLYGLTGRGKTFLSAAVAREVSGAGFSVFYNTAGTIFQMFEQETFQHEESGGNVERILRCDLLILDDLGSEKRAAGTSAALYQIVNTRLLEQRSTIINTNLSPDEDIPILYSPQIASRLEGGYQILICDGPDIRRLKQEKAQMEQANAQSNQTDTQLKQANMPFRQGDTRLKQANTRMEQANTAKIEKTGISANRQRG